MPKQTIQAMVEGGKATAGPPLGPALGPLGVPIPKIIQAINEKTKPLAGMTVPVKVIVDTATKSFDVEVGTPPVSALIKKELRIERGSQEAGKLRAGDLSENQVSAIAKMKFGSDAPAFRNQVIGSARSMGVTVGKGAVTQEEIQRYEQMKAAEEAAKEAAKAAPAAAAPAEGAKAEEKAPAKGEEKKEEKPAKEGAKPAKEAPAKKK